MGVRADPPPRNPLWHTRKAERCDELAKTFNPLPRNPLWHDSSEATVPCSRGEEKGLSIRSRGTLLGTALIEYAMGNPGAAFQSAPAEPSLARNFWERHCLVDDLLSIRSRGTLFGTRTEHVALPRSGNKGFQSAPAEPSLALNKSRARRKTRRSFQSAPAEPSLAHKKQTRRIDNVEAFNPLPRNPLWHSLRMSRSGSFSTDSFQSAPAEPSLARSRRL